MVSAWQKNNWRELRKTMGRFLAMVSIIALGVGFFVGLKSARPSMVNTCTNYLDRTRFYDLQLISSIGFDPDAADVFAEVDGVEAATASFSADLLTVQGESQTVYKTHLLPDTINQVTLTAGRMPQAADECLADDLFLTADVLGTKLTVEHQEDSVFSQDSYTIVGLCNSPQYLNLTRGTTSLGTGTITGFLFLTEDGYDIDYRSEIYLRLEREHTYFDKAYADWLETWEDPMLEILEAQGQDRLDQILSDARQELDDGWQEYHDGLEEFQSTKADVEAELAEAEQELADGKQLLEDGRKELENGETTLYQLRNDPYSIPELADARAQLDDGWQQLADGEAQYEEGLAQYNSMATPTKMLIIEAKQSMADAQNALNGAYQQYEAAEAAFRQTESALLAQQAELYKPVAEQQERLQASQAELASAEQNLRNLQQADSDPVTLAAAVLAVEAAQAEVLVQQVAYNAAKAAYDTQAAVLQAQLDAVEEQFLASKAALDASQTQVDALQQTIDDGEQQLKDAENQLMEAKLQIEESRAQLEEGEAALQQELQNAIAEAETMLANGYAELADAEQQYADGLKELEDGRAEAEREFADAEKELASAYRDLQQAELDLARMEDPSYYVLTPSSNAGYLSFDNDTNIIEGIAKIFPLFFFLVAALVCSSTMTRMVEEQRTQNGTLKAMGYSDGQIMMRYATYAGGAAVIGFILGVLIGTYLFPFVFWEAYKLLYHFGELDFVFNWQVALISLASALASSVGAACLAAWNDLQQMPAQLMRPKTPKAGKRIFLEYLPFLWNRLSFLAKVSLRNIFRYKKRLFMMILGTGGCLALLLAGLGLRDSISNVAEDQYGQITMFDYAITFDEFLTPQEQDAFRDEFADDLSALVFVGSSSMDVPTPRGIKSVSVVACSDPALDDLLGLYWEGEDLGYPTGDSVYVSHALAEDTGLQVGDMLSVRLESNDRIEIPVSGIFTNYVGSYLFMTEEGYETWFGIAPEIKSAYAVSAGDDPFLTGAKLQGHEQIINVSVSEDTKEMVASMMGALNAIMVLVVGCASALAFVVGYNLININITERVREIATIKVLGFYRKETHTYVFRESIILTILGAIVGVPLGIWLHEFIMNAVKVDFVCFQIQIAPLSFVLGIAMTLLVTIVVDKMLGKKIDRINMAESLKSVE